MTETRIRAALPKDVRKIEAVIQNAYGKYVERIGKSPAPMTADYGRLIAIGDVWVLEREGALAGLVVLKSAADYLMVGTLAVSTAYQGQGLGSKLLAHAQAQAWERGFTEMRLFTNELMHENLVLYRRVRWPEYDRAEQDGFRRVFMKKKVDAMPSE